MMLHAAPRETAGKVAVAPRYQPLVIVLAAACAGVVGDRLLGWPAWAWWPAAAVAWVVWLALWRQGRDRIAGCVLLVAVACGFAAWHHLHWCLFDVDDLGNFTRTSSGPACVEVVVERGPWRLPAPEYDPMRPVPEGDRTRLEVRVAAIRDGARWRRACGRSRLNVDGHLLGVRPGDRLRIFAQLTSVHSLHNPGEFDHAALARAQRRRSHLTATYPDCVTVIDRGRLGGGLSAWLERIRTAGDRVLWRYLDHRRSGLAAAVLLGAREELTAERSQAFMKTGTVHLLAISGLHVGIVVGAVLLALRLAAVPRGRALLVAATVAVLYTLLTDARPPAIRAAILVVVVCVGQLLGRGRMTFNSLAAAGLVVLVLNPADVFNTGVQLSFIAVAGLMWFGPGAFVWSSQPYELERLLDAQRSWPSRMLRTVGWSLRVTFLVSLIIWLLTTPLAMARFHLFTPIGILLNTVLWLPMAAALVSGFGVLVFGWLLPPVAKVFALGCDWSLGLLEWGIDAGAKLPGGCFWVPGPAGWWLVGFYGALALWAAFPPLRPPRRWIVALVVGWAGVGFLVPMLSRDRAELDCTLLSVGHGSAVVLQLPSGATILYDAGQFASPDYGARSIAACLWSRGVTHLDAVVLSHSDLDHYNAVPELLERFSVGAIYVSPVMFEEENQAMAALAESIRRAGVPIEEVSAGDRLSSGDDECSIEVLHPPRRGMLGGDNANSIVLAVEHRGRRILLPGDLASPGLEAVLAEMPWDCDVLVAPHHGSRQSDPPGLAAWCTPEVVVISGSHRYDVARTAAAYRAHGARVLHTAARGAVRVQIDPDRFEVSAFIGD